MGQARPGASSRPADGHDDTSTDDLDDTSTDDLDDTSTDDLDDLDDATVPWFLDGFPTSFFAASPSRLAARGRGGRLFTDPSGNG